MVFEFRCVGPIGNIYEFALQRNQNFGFASGMQFWYVQRFYLLLVYQDDIDAFLKLVDDVGLQIFVEGHECLTRSTPCRMHIDYYQFRILFVENSLEVVDIAYGRGEFYFFGRHN